MPWGRSPSVIRTGAARAQTTWRRRREGWLRCRCALLGGGYVEPEAAVEVDVVAAVLAGVSVADVGVEGVAVVGELGRAVGALDGGDLAGQAGGGGGGGAGDRGPVRGAAAVAL